MSSPHNGAAVVFDNFAFPLAIVATFLDGGNITDSLNIQEHQLAGKDIGQALRAALRFSFVGGIFVSTPNENTGNGTSNNTFTYAKLRIHGRCSLQRSQMTSKVLAPAPVPAEASQSTVSSLGFGVALHAWRPPDWR